MFPRRPPRQSAPRWSSMPDVLVLDTCVLPRSGEVRDNPLMSALLKVADLKGMRVVITDVVLEESVYQRLHAAEVASTALRGALAKASKVFRDEELGFYIPDPSNAANGWRTELAQTFEVWSTSGDDAREALFREAGRLPPARATSDGSATGSRDASIWLSVVRIAGSQDVGEVVFVSSNTRDFANSSGEFRADLSSDADVVQSIKLATSTAAAIGLLAEEVDTQPVDRVTIDVLKERYPALTQAVQDFVAPLVPDGWVEGVSLSSIDVQAAVERRAYIVDNARLSNVRAELTCEVSPPVTMDGPTETIALLAYLWIQVSDDGMTVEIENIRRRDES